MKKKIVNRKVKIYFLNKDSYEEKLDTNMLDKV